MKKLEETKRSEERQILSGLMLAIPIAPTVVFGGAVVVAYIVRLILMFLVAWTLSLNPNLATIIRSLYSSYFQMEAWVTVYWYCLIVGSGGLYATVVWVEMFRKFREEK